jgi:hypothetical protein
VSKRDFDKNFVIAILAGGVGIMLYEILQVSFKFWFTKTLSFDEFNNEIWPKAFAGISVALFALFYAVITRRKLNNKTDN